MDSWNSVTCDLQLGYAYAQTADVDLALAALMRAARLSGENSKALSMRGFLLATSGRSEDAREVLRTLEPCLTLGARQNWTTSAREK